MLQRLILNLLVVVVLCHQLLPVHGGSLRDLIEEIFTQAPETKFGKENHSARHADNSLVNVCLFILNGASCLTICLFQNSLVR